MDSNDPPVSALQAAGNTGMRHCAQLNSMSLDEKVAAVCLCTHIHYTCVHGDERSTSRASPSLCTLPADTEFISLNLELANLLGSVAGCPLTSPALGLRHTPFCTGARDVNSGPNACIASALPTGPSP